VFSRDIESYFGLARVREWINETLLPITVLKTIKRIKSIIEMEIRGIWISEDVWLEIFSYIGWEDLFKCPCLFSLPSVSSI
jgi:hypothetical protein